MNRLHYSKLCLNYCQNIKNSSAKLAFFIDHETLVKFSIYCRKTGIAFVDKITRYPTGFAIYPNSDIFEVLDETLQLLVTNGLASYFHKRVHHVLKFKDDQKHPKVLSCDDLSFGFIVWLVACAISAFIFIVELLFEFILKQLKIFTLNFVGIFLIVAWINTRQFV